MPATLAVWQLTHLHCGITVAMHDGHVTNDDEITAQKPQKLAS
jgi:hypothetical protein